ncbi:SIS domain-containing protein [Paenibacillus sp. TRM 82003]|uniref:SIS domain-containing protein n=1 Tax=Kineococcus sp. TRM81007 TaxID=2925831 RepID=UPI001F59DA72|nr:SIS domain-containing protein [Kineococcus sp. TRM81007]MCI2236929.1 SIS domain-containing protein [Kineococcus sp. TRM81007]MCI3921921.1 SIS domain-containing protein [Paenibacillus sp. TRM 82003]
MTATVARFVHDQPAVARDVLARVAPAAAAALSGATPVDRVLLVGSGTSHHASRVALADFAAGRCAHALVPSDAATELERWVLDGARPGLLVVGVSQSGRSTATLDVLRRARAAGARTLLVTGGPAERDEAADAVLDVGCGPEPVGAKTKGFTATVLALVVLGRLLARTGTGRGGTVPLPGTRAFDDLDRVPGAVEDVLRRSGPLEGLLAGSAPTAVHVVSWGPWRAVADEGALKLLETSLLPVESWDVEEFLHGPHRRLGPGSLLVVVGDRTRWGTRADALAGFVRSLGGKVLDVRSGGQDRAGPGHVTLALPAAPTPAVADVLPAVVPLQLLALALTAACGRSAEDDPFPDFHRLLGSKTPSTATGPGGAPHRPGGAP